MRIVTGVSPPAEENKKDDDNMPDIADQPRRCQTVGVAPSETLLKALEANLRHARTRVDQAPDGSTRAASRRRVTTGIACLDAQGRPDLQRLVEIFGGYDKITPSTWQQWDAAVAAYRVRMTAIATPAPDRHGPTVVKLYPSHEECCKCYAYGEFGYRKQTLTRLGLADLAALVESGELTWFCGDHRPGKYFADARRT